MAQLINEAKRFQKLAGLITESQLNEGIKTIDANSRDFKVEGNEEINPADLKPGTMITKIRSYHDKDELESEAGKFEKVENDYIYWKTKDGQEKSWRAAYTADLALVKNLEESQTNELFGFGKKSQFKPEQKVIYTASNGVTAYNGEYIVGKILSNGEIGLYPPDSPMKKISINAKPEELKLAESIEQTVNENLPIGKSKLAQELAQKLNTYIGKIQNPELEKEAKVHASKIISLIDKDSEMGESIEQTVNEALRKLRKEK